MLQSAIRVVWFVSFEKLYPITQNLRRSLFANLEPLSMAGLAPFAFLLLAPFLDQLIVCQGLDSLGVRDAVHEVQKARSIPALGPLFETVADGPCSPAYLDMAGRLFSIEYINRTLFILSVFQVAVKFRGDGVAWLWICNTRAEFRRGCLVERCVLG
jgi:hypothetical protein